MKNYIIAAIAVFTIGTPVMAGNLEGLQTPEVIAPADTRGIELSFTTVGKATDDLEDNWKLRGAFDVAQYNFAGGVSTVSLYGEFGEVAADEFGTVGAEYEWTYDAFTRTELALTGDVAYVMFNDYDDGDVIVSPSATVAFELTKNVDAFGEVGYAWDATNDWNELGGYTELGLDIGITQSISVVPSVVQAFDTDDDDVYGSLEVVFNF